MKNIDKKKNMNKIPQGGGLIKDAMSYIMEIWWSFWGLTLLETKSEDILASAALTFQSAFLQVMRVQ